MIWYRWKVWRLAYSWNRGGELLDGYGFWRHVAFGVWVLTCKRPRRLPPFDGAGTPQLKETQDETV